MYTNSITNKPTVVKQWTRNGWVRRVKEQDVRRGLRARISCNNDVDWDQQSRGEMNLIQDVHNGIMYGPVGHLIDDLAGPLRDLMQSPYTWHIVNTRLFKITDPETQVYKNGDWGSDENDADIDVFEASTPTSRLFLEQSGLIEPEADINKVTDILGAISDGKEVLNSPNANRVDIDVSLISMVPDRPDELIIDDINPEELDDLEVSADIDDELVMRHPGGHMMIPQLDFPKEVTDRVKAIENEYIELKSKASTDRELGLLDLYYEQALDRTISGQLTYSLNSPYCGHKYRQPRRMHEFIRTPKDSAVVVAAEDRLKFFHQTFGEAATCDSMSDLHGKAVIDDRKEANEQPNPNFGRHHRPGGFMGKIRGMYQHDKELAQAWSIYDKTDKDGKVTQKSAFNQAREEFIREWRDEQKGDEETLRSTLWAWFDREAKEVEAVYDEKTSKLVSSSRRYKDSIWRQKRTRALQDLFLTRKQWDAIYTMVGIAKTRLKLTKNPTKERREVLDELAKYFKDITNLYDLRSYMQWAQDRTVTKSGTVFLCQLDKISFIDESKWRQSCAKKRNYLTGRLVLFYQLREQVKSSQTTNLPELYLACSDPECNCMAIGHPEWFEIEDKEGLLGIKCDGCGKIVWHLEHKEIPKLKTYDQATNA